MRERQTRRIRLALRHSCAACRFAEHAAIPLPEVNVHRHVSHSFISSSFEVASGSVARCARSSFPATPIARVGPIGPRRWPLFLVSYSFRKNLCSHGLSNSYPMGVKIKTGLTCGGRGEDPPGSEHRRDPHPEMTALSPHLELDLTPAGILERSRSWIRFVPAPAEVIGVDAKSVCHRVVHREHWG